MVTNISGLRNVTTMMDLIIFENNHTGGLLSGLFLIFIFLLMLLSFRRYDFDISLATSSSICAVLGSFLMAAGLVNFTLLLGLLGLSIFSVGLVYWNRR